MSLSFNMKYAGAYVTEDDLRAMQDETRAAYAKLMHPDADTPGSDRHGWVRLPENYDRTEFARIRDAAARIRKDSEVLVVIGIGGSYLGARAAIEFCISKNYNMIVKNAPKIFFLGNSLSPVELSEVRDVCRDVDFSVNVISKSGTTTEPSVAFRIFKELLYDKYGEEGAAKRIYATTDRAKGTLKALADEQGYETFVIPDDVGGRYSVLTAVGLLPIACAGVDIDELMRGARDEMELCTNEEIDVLRNYACRYAAARNVMLRKGKIVEMMVCYEPDFTMMNEWFKQLFGESEGKDGKGIFPSSAIYSTDLHSLGQYVQEGQRILFETLVSFKVPKRDVTIHRDRDDADGLNYLAGRTLGHVNRRASQATVLAHTDGDVPNLVISMDSMDAYHLGLLIYFLEFACGVSGYILGINPFDQPGVEMYKKNMFALLGRPGYETQRQALLERLEETF